MLAEYNNNPFDIKASKATFQEVYERWSKEKFPTISKSNVKGYEASYRVCGTLYTQGVSGHSADGPSICGGHL